MTDRDAVAILRERQGTMYDPAVVETFIRIYRDIEVGGADAPGHRAVMQRVTQARQDAPSAQDLAPEVAANAPGSLLAFVSLSRVASGDASLSDVLALGSRLLTDVVPGATGAWYVTDGVRDRLVVAETFGPSAAALRGVTVAIGERLTGWVAANRQSIVNSDAALDLGPKADAASLRSCMSVPLLMGDSLVGVLSLYAPSAHAFADDCGRLIEMVAPHLAAAIHTASAAVESRTPADKAAAVPLRLVANR